MKATIERLRAAVVGPDLSVDLIGLIDALEAERAAEVLASTDYGQLTADDKIARQKAFITQEQSMHQGGEIGFILYDVLTALENYYP